MHLVLPHAGAGAGQAVEDGWVLGRTLSEYLGESDLENLGSLEACAAFYQKVRLPRAQKVQATSRTNGPTYDMQSPSMKDKDYESCVPIIANTLKDRMNFIWEAELDKAYDDAKAATAA